MGHEGIFLLSQLSSEEGDLKRKIGLIKSISLCDIPALG